MSPLQRIHPFLKDLLQDNTQLQLLGEDLELRPDCSGLQAAFPNQVHALPASDNSLMGLAVGMAMNGQTVILQVASASSLPQLLASLPAFGPDFPLSIILRVPVAPTEPISLDILLAYPHIQVRTAHDAESTMTALKSAITVPKPCIVLESLSPQLIHIAPDRAHTEIWAWGPGLEAVNQAAESLSTAGITCRVQALTQLHPIDTAVGQALFDTGRLVLVNLPTGLLSAVHQAAFWRLEHPPVFCNADAAEIERAVRTVMTP